MSHWVLAARIRTQESQYKLMIFDSCGIKAARKQLRTIRRHLIRIKLLEENDAWEALSLREQTEQECGVRMAIYMIRFMEWARAQEQSRRVITQIHKTISHEQADKADLASKYRKYLYQMLEREQNKIKK